MFQEKKLPEAKVLTGAAAIVPPALPGTYPPSTEIPPPPFVSLALESQGLHTIHRMPHIAIIDSRSVFLDC